MNPSITIGFEKENYSIASKSMGTLLPEKPQTLGKNILKRGIRMMILVHKMAKLKSRSFQGFCPLNPIRGLVSGPTHLGLVAHCSNVEAHRN